MDEMNLENIIKELINMKDEEYFQAGKTEGYLALELAIQKLQLLEQVEKGGMKKNYPTRKDNICLTCGSEIDEALGNGIANSMIDLANADLIRRLEGIKIRIMEILVGSIYTQELTQEQIDKLGIQLSQSITTYLTQGRKE